MSDRRAAGVERMLREAEERGEFQNLPGSGKPLPGIGERLDQDWWLRQKAARENIGDQALPVNLRLRREVADLETTLDRLEDETAVRAHLDELNERIRAALIGPPDGPPLHFGPVETETALAAWRERRR
ncbi:DUF1992 domain-containing protein [Glycomyces halotolerans]